MKRRSASPKGGAGRRSITRFSFRGSTSPFAAPQTTPSTVRAPKGTRTKSPGASGVSSGAS